jgi:hypothetical protein
MLGDRDLISEIRELLQFVLTEMSRRLSWRAVAVFFVGPIIATIGLLLGLGALLAVVKAVTSMNFRLLFVHAVSLYGEPVKLDGGMYYAGAGIILALMIGWIVAVPRLVLSPADGRKPDGEFMRIWLSTLLGIWLSALLACVLCLALGAGLPAYLPTVIYIAIVALQALVAAATIPFALSVSDAEVPKRRRRSARPG